MREFSASTILAAVVLCAAVAPRAEASEAGATCRSLNLAPTAVADCEQQLGAALTDADRAKVIRTFAAGLASAKADALLGQLTPSQAAPMPMATKAAAKQSPDAAVAAGRLAGTKAGSQHSPAIGPGNKSAPTAKPKAQKTSHQPAAKNAKNSGQ